MPRPLPPDASGSESPSHPSPAISFHKGSLSPRPSSHRLRTSDGRAVLLQEAARGLAEELLVGAEREVHGAQRARRSARGSFGRPSTRSAITFFWISDEPA